MFTRVNRIFGYILSSIYILITIANIVGAYNLPPEVFPTSTDYILKKFILPISLIITIIGSNTYHIIKEQEKNRDNNKISIDDNIYLALHTVPILIGFIVMAILTYLKK